jgi:hypothetical protein
MKNWKSSARRRRRTPVSGGVVVSILDLETLRYQPSMFKVLPKHCCGLMRFVREIARERGNYRIWEAYVSSIQHKNLTPS